MNQFAAEIINTKKNELFSTDNIDTYHNNIKRYLFKHNGYKLKYIQYYLNFFVYRQNFLVNSSPKNQKEQLIVKNKMIKDLFYRIKKTKKIITYKNYLKDIGIESILKSK